MSLTSNPSDTLVLRIIEKDKSAQGEDTDLYILYDTKEEVFLLRGKRSDTHIICQNAYSFESYSRLSVYEFLTFIIPKENECTLELYSYTDLPMNKNDITFELLREERSNRNEVVAYVKQRMHYNEMRRILSMLKFVVNKYA